LTGHSHDYKRNGTSTLFAAFEVATGKVIKAYNTTAAPFARTKSEVHQNASNHVSRINDSGY